MAAVGEWVGQAVLLAGATIALYLLLHRRTRSRPAPSHPMRGGTSVELCQVYPSPEDETATDIDIIAIHGLDTDSRTWTWNRDPNLPSVDWLKDPNMLPKRFPTARIFTCDWPADRFTARSTMQMTVRELARGLLLGIQARPGTNTDRPILFIASCLGGVILVQAMGIAAEPGSEYASIWDAAGGVVFLATPFRGTAFRDIAEFAVRAMKTYAWFADVAVTDLLSSLGDSTPFLQDLVGEFTRIWKQREQRNWPCHLAIFYETKKGSLLRNTLPIRRLADFLNPPKVLVPSDSARLDIVPNPVALERSHGEMNKFRGPDDLDFNAVAKRIGIIARDIHNGRPIQRADRWIRDTCYSLQKLAIIRLSEELLPMDQCYINLTIVAQPGGNADGRPNGQKKAQQSSPFSLLARLKVDRPSGTTEVALPNLFEPLGAGNGQTRRPRRILIRGRAGVGKSTLCKKIVYEFTYGAMWRDLFDRVLWVPLRNLKPTDRRQIGGYNLKNLFYDEYFSGHLEGHELANTLWSTSKGAESGNTLFILDGLDEVLYDLDGAMRDVLEELLNQPNVIITSRPNAMLPVTVPRVDVELETIGFHPDQVTAYVENAFTDPETRQQDSIKIGEVQTFLQRRPLMQGLVRIPIQLDAVCSTWDGFGDNPAPETMTAVYREIEKKLWKKDAVKLEKQRQGLLQLVSQSEISKLMKIELYLLEGLAFTGMHNDVIDFESQHRDIVSEHFGPPDTSLVLDDMLGRVSFLRTSGPSSRDRHQTYHFLHSTFQEYFAARYFVRQWRGGKPLICLGLKNEKNQKFKPARFLRRFKYDARYNIFWRFVAGLFDPEVNAETTRFFQTIEEEPRDLLGPTHQRVIMHCLSDVDASTSVPIRSTLEDGLSQWLLFECHLTGDSLLAREAECPDQVLRTSLSTASDSGDVGIQAAILRTLRHSRAHFSDATVAVLTALLMDKDEDNGVRSAAAAALSGQKTLSDAIVATFTALLMDKGEDEFVRCAAAHALGHLENWSEKTVTAAMALITDRGEDGDVRQSAAEALSGQTNLLDGAVTALAALLGDEDEFVRDTAAEALNSQRNLSDVIVAALTALLTDTGEDEGVRSAAACALSGQTNLPEAVVTALVALLGEGDEDSRFASADTLRAQANLSAPTVATLTAQLKDEDEGVRSAAADALRGQTNLPEPVVAALAALLRDEKSSVRAASADALQDQVNLPKAIVAALTAQISDEDHEVGSAAAYALRGQTNLPAPTLTTLVAWLKDWDPDVQLTAASTLGEQTNLPAPTVATLAALLKDRDSGVRCVAARALKSQTNLLDATVMALAALHKDKEYDVRSAAAGTLEAQANLPAAAFTALLALLKDEDKDVRSAAAGTLRDRANLPDMTFAALLALLKNEDKAVRSAAVTAIGDRMNKSGVILKGIKLLFESERAAERSDGASPSTLYNAGIVECWYESWLKRSFEENFALYVDGSHNLHIVDQTSGRRTASVDGCYAEFLDMLNHIKLFRTVQDCKLFIDMATVIERRNW